MDGFLRTTFLAALLCATALADTERERRLEQRIEVLERRVAALEERIGVSAAAPSVAEAAHFPVRGVESNAVTAGAYFDGNYTWNTARPHNRINLLRAYDVLHNNFNINQAGIVLERAVDAASNRRFGLRLEYMDDRHGLFSGVSQALKENTLTVTWQPRPRFQLRGEWRRDFSNQEFFFSDRPNRLRAEQNTATLGLLWWFGKEESWRTNVHA